MHLKTSTKYRNSKTECKDSDNVLIPIDQLDSLLAVFLESN